MYFGHTGMNMLLSPSVCMCVCVWSPNERKKIENLKKILCIHASINDKKNNSNNNKNEREKVYQIWRI